MNEIWKPKIGDTVVSKTWGMGSGDIGKVTSFKNKANDPEICVVFWTGKRADGTFGNLKGGCTCLIKNLLPYGGESQVTIKNPHAVALGSLGGKAGRGKSKARHVTSEQARKAVMVRWHGKLIGWTKGDGTSTEGYNVEDYFRDGKYLGPDCHGIEPILEQSQNTKGK